MQPDPLGQEHERSAQLDQQATDLDARLNSIAEDMRQQTETVQQLESESSERTQRGYAIDTELRQNRERMAGIALEIDRVYNRVII